MRTILFLTLYLLMGCEHPSKLNPATGTTMSQSLFEYDENGLRQGYSVLYGADAPESGYGDFVKVEEGTYEDDLRNGTWFFYNSDGSVHSESNYERGTLHGVSIVYDYRKRVETEMTYETGMIVSRIERPMDR